MLSFCLSDIELPRVHCGEFGLLGAPCVEL